MAVRTPIIAIVGRPNVGKSTLFNRILGQKLAVVEDFPGVTRDRNYALVERFDVPFYLVDTGGFEENPQEEMQRMVVEQTLLAVEEADLVLALFDGQAGCQPGDEDVVNLLRRNRKPVIFAVNKCDGQEQASAVADFYQLGMEELFNFSALHGRGIDCFVGTMLKQLEIYPALLASVTALHEREREAQEQLELVYGASLDAEIEEYDDEPPEVQEVEQRVAGEEAREVPPVYVEEDPESPAASMEEYLKAFKLLPLSQSTYLEDPRVQDQPSWEEEGLDFKAKAPALLELIKVAIIGRPNVGKSTLLNTLTGERRAITSPIAGTTRDSINLEMTREGQKYLLVDTAGLRREGRVSDRIEKYSTLRAMHALGECDVAIVLLDAVEGPTEQDGKIVGLAHEEGKGIVLVVNKWDAVEKDYRSMQKFKTQVMEAFKFAPYAPLLFVSAKTGKRCPKIMSVVKMIAQERTKRVSTNHLNQVLKKAVARTSPPSYRGAPVKLYYAAQVDTEPPRFLMFFNYPQEVHFSYLRFLKNAIREEFGFHGTDIKIATRKRGRRAGK